MSAHELLTASEPELTPNPIHPQAKIGHVHLKVANIDRALAFYCGVLGFSLKQRYGDEAAFISAGGYHHHIGLNTWESKTWRTTSTWHDRSFPFGHSLSNARSARRCPKAAHGCRHRARWRQ